MFDTNKAENTKNKVERGSVQQPRLNREQKEMNQIRKLQPDNHDVEYLMDEGPEVGNEGTNMTDVFPKYLANTPKAGEDSGTNTNAYMDENKISRSKEKTAALSKRWNKGY